jgi:hypothetical protein
MLAVACCAKLSAGKPVVKISTTSGGVHFGIISEKPASPAPTVFFFGKGIEETLAWPGFDDALVTLGLGVLKVAVDAPCHGFERRSGEPLSLSCWRYRLEHGSDVWFTVPVLCLISWCGNNIPIPEKSPLLDRRGAASWHYILQRQIHAWACSRHFRRYRPSSVAGVLRNGA